MTQGTNAADGLSQEVGKKHHHVSWMGFETPSGEQPLYWMSLLEKVIRFRKENSEARGEVWLTEAEFEKFLNMPSKEREWRNALLLSLFEEKVLPSPNHLIRSEILEFISMQEDEQLQWRDKLNKRKSTSTQEVLAERNLDKVTDTTPPQHRTRVRVRKSYVSPSREGTVTVSAHVEPELKDALKKKFEQSGYDNFNDFLSASLQSIVEKEPARELKPSAELAATALEQSRNLEKTISRLTQDLSRATLETTSRSR